MEIWDERVRLQDAHQRVERLRKSFEPTHLEVPSEQPQRRLVHRPTVRLRHVHVH